MALKYYEQLKHPNWQKKRLEIFERDNFACRYCGDKEKTLHVHHLFYVKNEINAWDYPNELLVTLCEDCHKDEHKIDLTELAIYFLKYTLMVKNMTLVQFLEIFEIIDVQKKVFNKSEKTAYKIAIKQLLK